MGVFGEGTLNHNESFLLNLFDFLYFGSVFIIIKTLTKNDTEQSCDLNHGVAKKYSQIQNKLQGSQLTWDHKYVFTYQRDTIKLIIRCQTEGESSALGASPAR